MDSKELRRNLGPIGSRGSLLRPEGPERYRVAQAAHGRDAVLPVGSERSLEQVGRARLEYEGTPLPSRACFAPQTKHAPGQQREADHLSEHRLVLVPANPSTGSVLGQENLLQVGRSKPGEPGRAFAQVQQKRGQVLRSADLPGGEVVLPAKGEDPSLAQVALELESPERQRCKLAHKLPFHLR